MTTWGLSATILAPAPDILRFAAYHLEQGAQRLYLYLDQANPEVFLALKAHPKIRVQTCDAAHWQKRIGRRPARHQVRQSLNATHAYARPPEVDWLIHMDVDEFLAPQARASNLGAPQARASNLGAPQARTANIGAPHARTANIGAPQARAADLGVPQARTEDIHVPPPLIADVLSALPTTQASARVRPIEQLGGSATAFKGFIPAGNHRNAVVEALYPTFGTHIRGGFLSHLAGKLFVRTGLPDITLRIHNAFQKDAMLPDATELTQIDLAHCHAKSWEAWRAAFAYRLQKGAYRADLKPATPAAKGGMSLHDLLSRLQADSGDAGLRQFYDEVIGDSAEMRARLEAHGLLRHVDLGLNTLAQKHFPNTLI